MARCDGCGRQFELAPLLPNYGEGWRLGRDDVCSRRCQEVVAWLNREQAKVTEAARPLPDNVVPLR